MPTPASKLFCKCCGAENKELSDWMKRASSLLKRFNDKLRKLPRGEAKNLSMSEEVRTEIALLVED
jgi:hypothetical protein